VKDLTSAMRFHLRLAIAEIRFRVGRALDRSAAPFGLQKEGRRAAFDARLTRFGTAV